MPKFNPKMSLSDIHNNHNLSFENKRSSFLKLLEKHIHFESFISFFVLQNVLGIPSDIMLINILNLSNELHNFCRFHNLVDITEPIYRKINEKKAKYLIYDTSGIELPVKENNPKFLETKLNETKKLSSTKKDSSDSTSAKSNVYLLPFMK